MSDIDCRNDCALPLRFPRRPGENLLIGHGDDCPCCSRPKSVSEDNRPALSRFNYRIGTYGSIREFLFHHINKTPELQNWTHRAPDDPAVALLEGAAILGDILTFYQETYANEAFLRTAQWRDSIADLVRLLGYRLSPAVGGNAIFAFEIKKDETVVIPAGFPLKATLEKPPKPSDFETTEEITAYPWLSRFNLYRPLVQPDIAPTTTEFYIKAPNQLLTPVEFKAGDRLLMGEAVGASSTQVAQEPSQAEVGMAEAANTWILIYNQWALENANAALASAESLLAANSSLVDKIRKAADLTASEAKMRTVAKSITDLETDVANLINIAVECSATITTASQTSTTLTDMVSGIVRDPAAIPQVANADLQAIIATLDVEADRIKNAVGQAANEAGQNVSASADLQAFLGELANPGQAIIAGLTQAAIDTENESKAADIAAVEAGNKAVRLAAIAASSAAAGASDRVAASASAKEADRHAGMTVTEASQVKPAIIALNNEAVTVAASTGLDVFLATLTGGLSLVFTAATAPARLAAWVNAYNRAITEADDGETAAENTKLKTAETVGNLSDSATKAADQSIKDREDAIKAIEKADRLASDAKTAAENMAYWRGQLLAFLGSGSISLLAAALTTKDYAENYVKSVKNVVNAIKALHTEDLREAIMPSSGVKDDEKNPARLKNAEIVIVDSIRELHGQKIFKIKGALKRTTGVSKLAAFKLGRSFHHFGYNGPPKTTKTDESTTSTATTTPTDGGTTTTVTNPPIPEVNIAFSRLLSGSTTSDETAVIYPGNENTSRIVSPSLRKLEFPLDSEVPDIVPGTTMVFQTTLYGSPNSSRRSEFTLVRKIKQVKPATQTWGLMTGSVSMVTLDKPLVVLENDIRYRIADIRDFMLYEAVSPLLTVKCVQEETKALKGTELNYYSTADEVMTLKDRRIMIYKPDGEPYLRNISEVPSMFLLETAGFKQLRRIRLSESVDYGDFPNLGPFADVFGNLVDANEGKRMPEVVIGSGDAMQIFQNFKLPKAPLTYHLVSENTPPESPELQIYVDGRQWTRVDSFFGRGKDEQIYIVRQDAQNNSWVQFGDGTTGARLTSGVDNVTAVYRIGDGAFGPLKDDTKVQASAKLKNLDKIQMPMEATGGTEPESGDSARIAAPAKVQSLGRIVSLRDYEAEALAIPGVVSAHASWQLRGGVPTVVVTVLMETGRSFEVNTGEGSVNHVLNKYDDKRGAGRNPVLVEAGRRVYVAVSVDYALKSGYRSDVVEPAIRRALGVNYAKPDRDEDQTGLFSLRRRTFGGREYASTVEGWVQNVDGVLWARTTALAKLPETDDPTSIILPSSIELSAVVTCAVSRILSLYDEHLTLKEVAS